MGTYNEPVFYHTFASNWRLDDRFARVSVCTSSIAQNGYLVTAFVTPAGEVERIFNTAGIALECNQIQCASSSASPQITLIAQGLGYPLVGQTSPYPNTLPIFTRIPRVELIGGAIPIVIWSETEWASNGRLVGSSVKYSFLSIGQDGLVPPDRVCYELPALGKGPADDVVDFETISVNDDLFLLWRNRSDPNFYLNTAKYTVGDPPQLSPSQQNSVLWQDEADQAMLSFSAQLAYLSDRSGVTLPVIAIATLDVTTTGPMINVRFVDLATMCLSSVFAPIAITPPCSCPSGSIVRLAWGSAPSTDGQAINGLSILLTPLQDQTARTGTPLFNVIDVSLENYGAMGSWTSMAPPASNYYADLGTNDNVAVSVDCLSTSLVPVVTNATDGSANALYNVCVFGKVFVTGRDSTRSYEFTEFFTGPVPAYKLTYVQGTPKSTTDLTDANSYDIQAAVSSWQLLGIVAGLPPYPLGYKEATASVLIVYDTSSTTGGSMKSAGTLKAGGTMMAIKTGVTLSSSKEVAQSTTVLLSAHQELSRKTVGDKLNMGWMIFHQPKYTVDLFEASTFATNVPSGVAFEMLIQSSIGGGCGVVAFDITQPNVPLTSGAIEKCLANFPAGFAGWPATNDTSAWRDYYDVNSWMLEPTTPPVEFNSITVSASTGGSKIEVLQQNTVKIESSQTIEASADCTIMKDVLGFHVGGSVTSNCTSTINAGTGFTIDIECGGFGDQTYTLQPLFFQASGANAPWVPNAVFGQCPWLLMWEVTNPEQPSAQAVRVSDG